MPDWTPIARSQDGVVSRRQLMAVGLSPSAVTRLVRRRRLATVTRGVFLVEGAPVTFRSRLWSAVLATDGILGFDTAAILWGLLDEPLAQTPTPGPCRTIHIVISHDRRLIAPHGVRLHRLPVARSAVTVRSGLPVTARTWTILDVLGTMPLHDARQLADRALQRGWIRPSDLSGRLVHGKRRRGNGVLRRLAGETGDGAAAQSERLLHRLLRRAGLGDWVANYPVWADGELIGVVDVAIPRRRLAIEVDGWAYHSDVDRFRRDRARQNELIMLGWTVLRFTWADLTDRPGYVVAAIRRMAA